MEGDLLGLGEEVVRIAVEHQAADALHRHQFLGDQLGRVEQVEAQRVLLVLRDHLHAQLPLGEVAVLDRLPQVAAMEVGILAGDLLRLVPDQSVDAQLGLPVELDEVRLAARIHEAEGVDAEALHHPVAARDGAIAHGPHQHVGRFGHQRDEVPERVVRARRLRDRVVRFRLDGMNQVRELHRVLDEEHRHVVAHQVVVALLGIELDREAAHVAHRVGRAAFARHGREAHENGRALRRVLQEVGRGELRHRLVDLEVAMRGRAARMDHALRDALVVEMRDLLAQDEILQQRRSAHAGLERVVVVGDVDPLVGRELGDRLLHETGELLLLRVDGIAGFRAAAGSRPVS